MKSNSNQDKNKKNGIELELKEKGKLMNTPFIMKILSSIRAKLLISFFIPIAFIIILGITAYTSSSKSIISTFTDSTINTINSTGNYYGVIMQTMEDKATQLAVDNIAKKYYSGNYSSNYTSEGKALQTLKNNVSSLALADKYINNIAIFTSYGSGISSYGEFKEQSPYDAFESTEEAALINDSLVWTGYHRFLDEKLGISASDYAMSLTNEFLNLSAKKIGYIQMDLDMKVVTDVLSSIELPGDSELVFIAPDGRETKATGDAEGSIVVNNSFYDEAKSGQDINGKTTVDYKGKKHLFIYSKINDTGAMVAALVPSAALTRRTDAIKYLAVILIIFSALIAGFIGFNVSASMDNAIKNIIKILSKASDGDLTVAVDTKRKDEFKILSDSTNHMINNMKNLITKAAGVGNTVITSSNHVTKSSERLLTASKDISLAITEIQQGITQQAYDAENCLRQTDSLAKQINLVHDNSVAIEQIASNTRNVIKDGIDEIDELNIATKSSIKITDQTITDIEELEKESKTITDIIAVINDIAAQTNLLSLNASIEAARAGDAGRGFSVVADEIRKLSEKSVSAADEIEEIINRITKKTHITVSTVKQAETITRTTESRLMNVIQLFHNINLHVDDLAEKLSRIAKGINDIDSSKNDTLAAIESISSVAEETSAASEEVEATAQQQLEAVTQLNEAVKALKKDAYDLDVSIQLFKTK
jgi:methyl-accepting chemotaxis protein